MVRPVSTRVPKTLGTLLRFFAAGAILVASRQLVGAGEPPRRPLTVEVPENADEQTVEAAIDEALLLDFAIRAGWHRSDAVVRERLVRNLAVAGDADGATNETIDRAIGLGIHLRDPIARSRLVDSARRALERTEGEPEPTLEQVKRAVEDDPERYRVSARVRFQQVFLSFQRRANKIDDDARDIERRIAGGAAGVEALSDPWPWTATGTWQSTDRLDGALGEGFGAALAEAPLGRFTGPIRSSFGLHFVRVEAREDAHEPPPEAVRARVTENLSTSRRDARLNERIAVLRQGYAVTVARSR